jgi:hypothetical protein
LEESVSDDMDSMTQSVMSNNHLRKFKEVFKYNFISTVGPYYC